MRDAKVNGEPYLVKEVTQDDIFDFETLSNSFIRNKAQTSLHKEIMVKPDEFKFFIKFSLEEDKSEALHINRKGFTLKKLKNLKLKKLYNEKIPLSFNKKRDVKK